MVRRKKTGHPVQFELTDQCRDAVADWIAEVGLETFGYGTHSLRRTKAMSIYRFRRSSR